LKKSRKRYRLIGFARTSGYPAEGKVRSRLKRAVNHLRNNQFRTPLYFFRENGTNKLPERQINGSRGSSGSIGTAPGP
jgi:hypothetical protein